MHGSGDAFAEINGVATILDAEEEMGQLRAEYEQSRDALRERHPALQDLTFAIVASLDNQWAVFPKDDSSNVILSDLGFHFIDEAVSELRAAGEIVTWLPYEQLRLLESADVILRMAYSDEAANAAFETLQRNPLWQNLPAVQRDMVFTYPGSSASSYGWALMNLDELASLFADIQGRLDAR